MTLPASSPPRVESRDMVDIVFSVLGVAFAAFCVWLGAHLANRHERWAKRTAVGLAVVMAYALLWGPACWIWHATPAPDWVKICLDVIYFRMDWLHWNSL